MRSVDKTYTDFNKTEDYPRRHLAEYDNRHDDGKAQVVKTVWKLDEFDKKSLADEFGEDAVNGDDVTIRKHYGSDGTIWSVPIDEAAILDKLITQFGLSDEEADPVRGVKGTWTASSRLKKIEERTASPI